MNVLNFVIFEKNPLLFNNYTILRFKLSITV